MEIVWRKIGEIKPYEDNPRRNDEAVEAVANSIKAFGWNQPIVVDRDGVIIAGHTRYKAAKKLGLEQVPALTADHLTDVEVKAYRLADNKTAELAEWDWNKLDKELAEIEADFMEMAEFGFMEAIVDEYDTDFALPAGDKPAFCQVSFILHERQKELISMALEKIGDSVQETFGNTNKKGNALYEIVKQWEEQKK